MTLKNKNKHWGLLDSILATILIVLGSLLVNNIFSKIFQDLHFPILILISTWIFSIKKYQIPIKLLGIRKTEKKFISFSVFALFHFNYYNGSKLFLFIPIFFFALCIQFYLSNIQTNQIN